jgi:hypothetical protein
LTLGDGHQMKLDVDPFPVDMIDFAEKKVLVRQDQAGTTRGKNVLVSDEFRLKMLKPKNPEVGVWKENARRKDRSRWKPMSSFLIEKYTAQRRGSVHSRLGGHKRERSPCYDPGRKAWTERQYRGQQEPVRRQYRPQGHLGDNQNQGWYQHRDSSALHYEGQASWTDHATVDCGMPLGGPSGREEESRTSEAIILVGSIPCPMPAPSQLDT